MTESSKAAKIYDIPRKYLTEISRKDIRHEILIKYFWNFRSLTERDDFVR